MKLESEHTPEADATPELVDALLRDGARRGAWLVLRDEADDGRFVQAEEDGEGFALEWRDGSAAPLRRASRVFSRDEAQSAFRAFLAGDTDWTARYDWTDANNLPVAGASVTRKGLLTFLAAFVAAFVAADLVTRFELCFIGGIGPLSDILDPLALYKEFVHSAAKGEWADFFAGLFWFGLIPVPLLAAAVCTAVWKTIRKAALRAALFAALAEAIWFFPIAAGCHC